MKIFIYDTETTGFGKKDEVIQISGILTDIDFNAKSYVNEYCFTNVNILPGAEKTHGINRDLLYRLSGGLYFEDVLEKIPFIKEERDLLFIAYNQNFDMRLINQTLVNNGLQSIDFGRKIETLPRNLKKGRYNFCAMRAMSVLTNGGRNQKLVECATRTTGYTHEQLSSMFDIFIGAESKGRPHDALYDSFLIWIILSKNRGLIYT